MAALTKATKPVVLRNKVWVLRVPGQPDVPFLSHPMVERVLIATLKLWPYYQEPDSIHGRRADMVPSNLELLICLCNDVEEAIAEVLDAKQAALIFKTFADQFTRKRVADESDLHYTTVYWRVQAAFLNLVYYLQSRKRWDLLGADDGYYEAYRTNEPQPKEAPTTERPVSDKPCKDCLAAPCYVSPRGKRNAYCIKCIAARTRVAQRKAKPPDPDDEGRLLEEC